MSPTGATSAAPSFARSRAVAERLGPGPLRHVGETGSTNADLVKEARAGDTSGAVLVADHQTAGRGRLDRSWDDDPGGALLVSLRIPTSQSDAAAVVAAVGVAARTAADGLTSAPVLAKWPNDLVVVEGPAPGKLAGVLAEFVEGHDPVVVVGVGVNIAPITRHAGSTSIAENGGPADRDVLLAALLRELAHRLDAPQQVLDELRAHSATLGGRVRAELPGGEVVEGLAVRLDDHGRLVVRGDDEVEVHLAVADVIHLRPG